MLGVVAPPKKIRVATMKNERLKFDFPKTASFVLTNQKRKTLGNPLIRLFSPYLNPNLLNSSKKRRNIKKEHGATYESSATIGSATSKN